MPSHRALTLSFVVLSLLSACARVEPPIAAPTQAVTTNPPLPSRTPTPEPAPTLTPTTQVVCRDREGRVLADEIKLPEDTRPLVYRLYLPPCFDPGRAAPYPTLYLLHGLAQSESEWIDLGIATTADRLIAEGSIPAMLIVMPGERTGYDMLVALTDTLLPHLERSLPSGGRPELRAIGGLSHGGGWALRIGFQHPELFRAIGLHSPAVISPDLYLLPTWATEMPSESHPAPVDRHRIRRHAPPGRPRLARQAGQAPLALHLGAESRRTHGHVLVGTSGRIPWLVCAGMAVPRPRGVSPTGSSHTR